MRVYPKASRIDSSNFNPLIGWIYGAQMVAFNMQVPSTFFLLIITYLNILLVLNSKTTNLLKFCLEPWISFKNCILQVCLCQGHDRSLWLMQGMFRANGGCGYVKKPDLLLKVGPDNEVFDPKKKGLPVKKILKVIDNSKISFFWHFQLLFRQIFLIHLCESVFRWRCTWEKVGIWILNTHTLIYIPRQTSTSR